MAQRADAVGGDVLTLSRYPFLPEAGTFVEQAGVTLDALVTERVYANVRARGVARVASALADAKVALSPATSRAEALEDFLSYAYARMLVSATKDAHVVRRHALAEAVRVKEFLDDARDTASVIDACAALGLTAAPLDADSGFGERLPWRAQPETGERGRSRGGERERASLFTLPFTQYLVAASAIRDTDWKLVTQPTMNGLVAVDRRRLSRLAQEILRRRIERELPLPLDADLAKALEADVAPIRAAAKARAEAYSVSTGPADLALLPPCMRHILGQLQRGENAPHTSRFAVTSFLHTIGLESEDIIKLFAQAPDFKEELTRYQVEHITGKSSGTEYSPPGCQAMKTWGICVGEDDWCRRTNAEGERYVSHPLSWYRWAAKRKARGQSETKSSEPTRTAEG
ncbi:MAG: hypothetical protein ACYDCK_14840 [Thermoplasmatota archaeon]